MKVQVLPSLQCEKHNEEKILYGDRWKCKSCNREYQRKWFADNKEKQLLRVKKNSLLVRDRNREYLWNYFLDNPCTDCGESDPRVLEFDHLESKKYNISEMLMFSLKTVLEEIAKCEVVCSNCHRKRTYNRGNSWRHIKFTS